MNIDLQRRFVDLSDTSLNIEVSLRSHDHDFGQNRCRFLMEFDTTKQCLAICNTAAIQASKQRVQAFGDVSVEDNSQQILVSTIRDLVNTKNIKINYFSSQ
ncbi:hypothetical protein GGI35DRAFT_464557 [Trichoderma velutinum]